MLSIGLMSGTSMDGIDAALLETDGESHVKELGNISIPYDSQFKTLLKAAEYAIRQCNGYMDQSRFFYPQALKCYLQDELKIEGTPLKRNIDDLFLYLHENIHSDTPIILDDVIALSTQLHGRAIEKLLEKTGYTSKLIDVVGYHGQAMFHQPSKGVSVIVGDGQALAEQTGITVVYDFRSCDIAAGGQGAPFAPLYHLALAKRDHKIPLVVVNCGGIANISLIRSDRESDLIGFDTGPGNGLIDRLVKQRTSGQEVMDEGGQYGLKGKVHQEVLAALYEKSILKDNKNYFLMPPPKALDIGDMQLIEELDDLSLPDACRTLEAFTAFTIVKSLDLLKMELPKHWILAGGGWNNPVIRFELNHQLRSKIGDDINIATADEAGWNSQALEAQIFAYLAIRSLQNKPLSFPGTTRVPTPLSGGRVCIPHTGPKSPGIYNHANSSV